ncbi:MAG TPA: proton-conducting transporter membrane subunit, partial [Desulfobacterales bacterium]|nr:proton-conducting transporter membrane subunit [Desulfobacterales bacterium]
MIEILFLIPLATGALAFFLPRPSGRTLLTLTGAVHLVLSILLWVRQPEALFAEYFAVTPEGLLSLLVISLLFFLISIYTAGYLEAANIRSERVFTGSMLVFLSTMTMVTLSDHIMVMWIAIEATTLASAPLIYTHRSAATLEATLKYVLICSVGIALALLGTFCLGIAASGVPGGASLTLDTLEAAARSGGMARPWLKAAFVLALVGYGTKMGLAPLHTWLPDAHSQAPSPVSALLS